MRAAFSILRRTPLVLLSLFLVPALLPAEPEPTTPPRAEELWYRVELSGEPAGYMVTREIRSQSAEGEQITSEVSIRIRLSRGGAVTELEMDSSFSETTDGRPLVAQSRQKLGLAPVEITYRFGNPETVEVERRQAEQVTTSQQPWPAGDWLTPAQLQAELARRVNSNSKKFELRGLDPLLGLEPVVISWQLEAREAQIAAAGQTISTSRWRQEQSHSPGIATIINLDAEGLMRRSATSMLGLELVAVQAERDEVLRIEGAPELMARTFIYPSRTIERPRQLRRAVYKLTLDEGQLPGLPSIGYQRSKNKRRYSILTVELGSSQPKQNDLDLAPYLRSTPYLDFEHDSLRLLHQQALDEAPAKPLARAQQLRRFVAEFVAEKNLDSLLATATEVAASHSGDCTEHAVLLAALLRADGIPARVVTGLIYVDSFVGQRDLFGYHMWTQGLIDDRWVDLDATLSGDQPFDAAHIAFTVSALADEASAMRDMAAIVPAMGSLQVEVLETGY